MKIRSVKLDDVLWRRPQRRYRKFWIVMYRWPTANDIQNMFWVTFKT